MRYLQSAVEHDLAQKLVFVGGPRQPRHYRDIDGREIDFVLTDQDKAIGFVECEWDDAEALPWIG